MSCLVLLLWTTLLCCRRLTRVIIILLSPCGGLGQELCSKPPISLASQEYLLQKKCLLFYFRIFTDTFYFSFQPFTHRQERQNFQACWSRLIILEPEKKLHIYHLAYKDRWFFLHKIKLMRIEIFLYRFEYSYGMKSKDESVKNVNV